MKTASTDMTEPQAQEEENTKREQNRNFWIAIFQGIFGRISFSLSDSTTVLSAFIYKLTASNTVVGLTGSLMSVGWMCAPTVDLQSTGTQTPEDAVLYSRHECAHRGVDCSCRRYGVDWRRQLRLTRCRFHLPLFPRHLVDGRVIRCLHGHYLQDN